MMSSSNTLRIAGIVEESIVDGPGIRFTIFTQGCTHNCKGCHNPTTHDINGGRDEDIDDIVKRINENPLLKGITLSGGEPFMQPIALSNLIDKIKPSLDVITYTGFKFEELLQNEEYMELLKRTDILIDGEFEIDKKSDDLMFRGSSNQRAIDVKKSLESGKIIEHIF